MPTRPDPLKTEFDLSPRAVAVKTARSITDVEIVRYRIAGWTWDQIADKTQLAVATVKHRCKRALEEHGSVDVEMLRNEQDALLREMRQTYYADFVNPQPETGFADTLATLPESERTAVKVAEALVIFAREKAAIRDRAADKLLAVEDKRAKLWGTYAPARHEMYVWAEAERLAKALGLDPNAIVAEAERVVLEGRLRTD